MHEGVRVPATVDHGRPSTMNTRKPARVARAIQTLDLGYVVITSVDRDDLADGGAAIFASTICETRAPCQSAASKCWSRIAGDQGALRRCSTRGPTSSITTPNGSTSVQMARSGATARTLALLDQSRHYTPDIPTKTGLIVGLGEELGESSPRSGTCTRRVQHPDDRHTLRRPTGMRRSPAITTPTSSPS